MNRRAMSILLPLIVGLLAFPTTAASQETTTESGTWRGTIQQHGDHYDYVGSPCPTQSEFCIQVIVTYRIVPVTRQAAMALPRVEGRTARLVGELDSTGDEEHQGTLYVTRVTG